MTIPRKLHRPRTSAAAMLHELPDDVLWLVLDGGSAWTLRAVARTCRRLHSAAVAHARRLAARLAVRLGAEERTPEARSLVGVHVRHAHTMRRVARTAWLWDDTIGMWDADGIHLSSTDGRAWYYLTLHTAAFDRLWTIAAPRPPATGGTERPAAADVGLCAFVVSVLSVPTAACCLQFVLLFGAGAASAADDVALSGDYRRASWGDYWEGDRGLWSDDSVYGVRCAHVPPRALRRDQDRGPRHAVSPRARVRTHRAVAWCGGVCTRRSKGHRRHDRGPSGRATACGPLPRG